MEWHGMGVEEERGDTFKNKVSASRRRQSEAILLVSTCLTIKLVGRKEKEKKKKEHDPCNMIRKCE